MEDSQLENFNGGGEGNNFESTKFSFKDIKRVPPSFYFGILLVAAMFVFIPFLQKRQELKFRAQVQPAPNTPAPYIDFVRKPLIYWQTQQRDDGNFNDVLDGVPVPADQYGHSNLGADLIWLGLKESNPLTVKNGIRAINYHINNSTSGHIPFNGVAVAYAYNLLKDQPDLLTAADKAAWETYLTSIEYLTQFPKDTYTSNWQLVQAGMFSQLQKTGLQSPPSQNSNVLLGICNGWSNYYANVFMKQLVPAKLDNGYGGDPGSWPTAYHSFAAAWVARYLLDNLESDPSIKEYFLKMAETSMNLMGPDGDIAYFGRSNQESFALASSIFTFEYAAKVYKEKGDLGKAGQFRRAAQISFDRLQNVHGLGIKGDYINIIPKLKFQFDRNSLDTYANLPTYNGLTMLLLTMAQDTADTTIASVPLEMEGSSFSRSYSTAGMAIFKKENLWYAVAFGNLQNQAKAKVGDIRYDSGLIRAKKLVDGQWRDLVQARPYTPDTSLIRWSTAPRGFYNGIPFVLQGTSFAVSENGISLTAKAVNRNTGDDLGFSTTLAYQVDKNAIRIAVPPYNPSVTNFYASNFFSGQPTRSNYGCSIALTDQDQVLTVDKWAVQGSVDLQQFYNAQQGTVYFNRHEITNPGRGVTISLDAAGGPVPSCFAIYFGNTDRPTRMVLESKYNLRWMVHAGLPPFMGLDTARQKGYFSANYWPGYSVAEGDPACLQNEEMKKYAEPSEIAGKPERFVLYYGNTPVAKRIELEGAFGLKWINHAGLPDQMTLGVARQQGIIGQTYWPGYSVYTGNKDSLGNEAFKSYLQPQEVVEKRI